MADKYKEVPRQRYQNNLEKSCRDADLHIGGHTAKSVKTSVSRRSFDAKSGILWATDFFVWNTENCVLMNKTVPIKVLVISIALRPPRRALLDFMSQEVGNVTSRQCIRG